jgi:hypothetical protein
MGKAGSGSTCLTWLQLERHDLAYLVDAVHGLLEERSEGLHVAGALDDLLSRVVAAADDSWQREQREACNEPQWRAGVPCVTIGADIMQEDP